MPAQRLIALLEGFTFHTRHLPPERPFSQTWKLRPAWLLCFNNLFTFMLNYQGIGSFL
jgi:hypothetical protein